MLVKVIKEITKTELIKKKNQLKTGSIWWSCNLIIYHWKGKTKIAYRIFGKLSLVVFPGVKVEGKLKSNGQNELKRCLIHKVSISTKVLKIDFLIY